MPEYYLRLLHCDRHQCSCPDCGVVHVYGADRKSDFPWLLLEPIHYYADVLYAGTEFLLRPTDSFAQGRPESKKVSCAMQRACFLHLPLHGPQHSGRSSGYFRHSDFHFHNLRRL